MCASIALLLLYPSSILAIGVSATPATLSLQTSLGREGVTRFTVGNPSSEVGLFEAYPEEFEQSIALVPSRFVLEAGEKREIVLRAKRREAGSIRTAIAVEARALGAPEMGVGGGVRLPFSLTVSGENRFSSAVFFSGSVPVTLWFLLGALTAFFLLRRVSLSTLKR